MKSAPRVLEQVEIMFQACADDSVTYLLGINNGEGARRRRPAPYQVLSALLARCVAKPGSKAVAISKRLLQIRAP